MPEIPPKATRAPAAPSLAPPASKPAPTPRVLSLDALRGFDMFWIIGGDKLAVATIALFAGRFPEWAERAQLQFKHSDWKGFTAYDLIMPLFLFVVGAAMPFSFSRRIDMGHSKGRLYFKILRRTVILFVVGMMVQGHLLDFNLATLHIFSNTLQAIAIGYLIAGILMLVFPLWAQIAAAVFLMLLYWGLLMFIPIAVDGKEAIRGVLEPHANVAYIVEKWMTGRFIDGTEPPYTWVLSGITFAATTLLGVFAGYVLRSGSAPVMKFVWLALLGAVCLAGGWAWAEYLHFPIIKHIWTSSMVLWAAGWSYLLLALFYLVIDVIGLRIIAFPLVVIGMNAIVAYVAYHLFHPNVFETISANLVGGLAHYLGPAEHFALALTTVLLVWLLLYHLYRHKIFLRI